MVGSLSAVVWLSAAASVAAAASHDALGRHLYARYEHQTDQQRPGGGVRAAQYTFPNGEHSESMEEPSRPWPRLGIAAAPDTSCTTACAANTSTGGVCIGAPTITTEEQMRAFARNAGYSIVRGAHNDGSLFPGCTSTHDDHGYAASVPNFIRGLGNSGHESMCFFSAEGRWENITSNCDSLPGAGGQRLCYCNLRPPDPPASRPFPRMGIAAPPDTSCTTACAANTSSGGVCIGAPTITTGDEMKAFAESAGYSITRGEHMGVVSLGCSTTHQEPSVAYAWSVPNFVLAADNTSMCFISAEGRWENMTRNCDALPGTGGQRLCYCNVKPALDTRPYPRVGVAAPPDTSCTTACAANTSTGGTCIGAPTITTEEQMKAFAANAGYTIIRGRDANGHLAPGCTSSHLDQGYASSVPNFARGLGSSGHESMCFFSAEGRWENITSNCDALPGAGGQRLCYCNAKAEGIWDE